MTQAETVVRPLEVVRREAVLEALKYHHGNRTLTARDLGVSLRTLRIWINSYRAAGFDVPPSQGGPRAHCPRCGLELER